MKDKFILKSDNYDPTPLVEDLLEDAQQTLGSAAYRMVAPELEYFIRYRVAKALLSAFSKAEALYINDSVKQANQATRNMLNAVMTQSKIQNTPVPDNQGN